MALPTCPKCEMHRFEMQTIEPIGSNVKVNTIQCASCGTVVGITDFYTTADLLFELAKKLNITLTR